MRPSDADLFLADLMGEPITTWPGNRHRAVPTPPRLPLPRPRTGQIALRPVRRPPLWAPPYEQAEPAQEPYLPTGGRAYAPQAGLFSGCHPAPFVVIAASFLPRPTADADAAIDAALTAAGLDAAERRGVARGGLRPIAEQFGAPALTELVARLRWSRADFGRRGWSDSVDSMLVPRLLLHIPGHFRELARRAPDGREAFVLESLGWLLMTEMRRRVAAASRREWWLPPPPSFVTAMPNPLPPLSADVSALVMRYLLVDTLMPMDRWNAQLMAWGTGLAGRQWQAEVNAPDPGRPFYAGLLTVPAHIDTTAPRARFDPAWASRRAATDAQHPPHAAGAAVVTLSGLRNAVALRDCPGNDPHLPARAFERCDLQGLELIVDFPATTTNPSTRRRLPLMADLLPVYNVLFRAISELGWNDLLYQTSGGACFRGVKHDAADTVTINGQQVLVNPFHQPNATTVTRINTLFAPPKRARVLAAARTARTMSEHGIGAAIDFNVQENRNSVASRPFGSMDPRIVAIFEAFHFRWGACFNPTDPMHFDYCSAVCAPVPANAGTGGAAVTPRMQLPVRAGRVVA
ncbi:MAG: M15 family metallopeptidase [Vicinamibacterales bacterium]|jgi:hypothetical protein